MTLISVPGLSIVNSIPVVPETGSIMWTIPAFKGYSRTTASSITMNTIDTNTTSAEVPFALIASAKNVTCVGSRTWGVLAINPYEHLEHTWLLTYNDDSAVESDDEIIDPNTLLAVNSYTDQEGFGEACFIIHNPGTYKLTLTSSSANGTSNSTTATITASVPTYSHQFIDTAQADDTNDGFDPWGFATSTATYTESTGALNQTNAFTSYVHDSVNYLTESGNWIYLISADSGALGTWHRIASKTSNSEIILTDKIGSDQTNVVSSDGPKKVLSSTLASDTMVHLKSGNSHSLSTEMSTSNKTGLYMVVYGGTSKATITASATMTEPMFDIAIGSSSAAPDIVYCNRIIFDANDNAVAGWGGNNTETGGSGHQRYTLDRCKTLNGTQAIGVQLQDVPELSTYDFVMWGHYGINRKVAAESRRQGVYTYLHGSTTRQVVYGSSFESYCDDIILDHHLYLNGASGHRLFAYNDFPYGAGDAEGPNFCLNDNLHTTNSFEDYFTIVHNKFENARYGVDQSNGSDNPALVSFRNSVIKMNSFMGLLKGAVRTGTSTGCFIAYNVINAFTGTVEGAIYCTGTAGSYWVNANNYFYDAKYCLDIASATQRDIEFVDNVAEYTGSSAFLLVQYDSTEITTDDAHENNQFYAPNVSGDYIEDIGGSSTTLAQYNTAASQSIDNTHAAINYPDPTGTGGFHDFRI